MTWWPATPASPAKQPLQTLWQGWSVLLLPWALPPSGGAPPGEVWHLQPLGIPDCSLLSNHCHASATRWDPRLQPSEQPLPCKGRSTLNSEQVLKACLKVMPRSSCRHCHSGIFACLTCISLQSTVRSCPRHAGRGKVSCVAVSARPAEGDVYNRTTIVVASARALQGIA